MEVKLGLRITEVFMQSRQQSYIFKEFWRMYKLDKIKNNVVQKELNIFSVNGRIGDYRQNRLTHLNRMYAMWSKLAWV